MCEGGTKVLGLMATAKKERPATFISLQQGVIDEGSPLKGIPKNTCQEFTQRRADNPLSALGSLLGLQW